MQPFDGAPMTRGGPAVGVSVGSLHDAALTGTLSSVPIIAIAISAPARMMASRYRFGIVWRADRNSAKGTVAAASQILNITGHGRVLLDRAYHSGLT